MLRTTTYCRSRQPTLFPALPPPTLPQPQPVILNVLVPRDDAQVFLGTAATTSTGTERRFESPPMQPGKRYQYTVTARWMQDGKMVEQKRDVPVQAGQEITVDFRAPGRENMAPPEIKSRARCAG